MVELESQHAALGQPILHTIDGVDDSNTLGKNKEVLGSKALPMAVLIAGMLRDGDHDKNCFVSRSILCQFEFDYKALLFGANSLYCWFKQQLVMVWAHIPHGRTNGPAHDGTSLMPLYKKSVGLQSHRVGLLPTNHVPIGHLVSSRCEKRPRRLKK
jgi:hypothetical protein